MGEFVDTAEALRHLTHELVMDMQDDRVAGGFNPQHCFSEQIASNTADDVLNPKPAVCALAVAARFELSEPVVAEYNVLLPFIADDVRLRVRELASTRQLQLKERAVALEGDGTAADNAAALAYCGPGRTIDVVPKALDPWVRGAPISLELLYFGVGETVRLELPPRSQTAAVSEG